jgi:hypothetical protein
MRLSGSALLAQQAPEQRDQPRELGRVGAGGVQHGLVGGADVKLIMLRTDVDVGAGQLPAMLAPMSRTAPIESRARAYMPS